MALDKYDGDPWGVDFSFSHIGQGLLVDVGVCAHFGSRGGISYRWATLWDYPIDQHASMTTVIVSPRGEWQSEGFDVGAYIGAQCVVAKVGQLPPNNSWSIKYGEQLQGIDAWKVGKIHNGGSEPFGFKNMGPGGGGGSPARGSFQLAIFGVPDHWPEVWRGFVWDDEASGWVENNESWSDCFPLGWPGWYSASISFSNVPLEGAQIQLQTIEGLYHLPIYRPSAAGWYDVDIPVPNGQNLLNLTNGVITAL